MTISFRRKTAAIAALTVCAVLTVPAVADVKAGVDAWSRGEYRKAVDEWRPAAVAGDPDAQFNLGQAYKLGRGVPVDLALAEEWYRKAALQGHVQAQDNYALALFQNGKREEAVPWLEKSSARGEPRAQLVLGTMLFNGDIIKKDWVRAYALMVRSSASGLPQGSQTLAQMDQYIPVDVRQQGIALARQYETDTIAYQNQPEVAGQRSPGSIRDTDLPASTAADNNPAQTITPPAKPRRPVAAAKLKPAPVAEQPEDTAQSQPLARSSTGKGWRIQVGAFREEGNARGLWQQLQGSIGALSGLQPYFVKAGTLTKLQIGPIASADLGRVCGAVKSKASGTPCVPIAP